MNRVDCSVEGCGGTPHLRGWCQSHYNRWRRHGDPLGGGAPKRKGINQGKACSAPGCSKSALRGGMCGVHDSRLRRHGSFDLEEMSPEERFWAKVSRRGPDECWEWTAGLNSSGYAWFWLDGKNIGGHVFAYQSMYGDVPDGLEVCHRCHNRCCVNPVHLYAGTHQDNMRDMVEAQRQVRGSRQHKTHLSEDDVRLIRHLCESGMTQQATGELFGVSQGAVSNIVLRQSWSHVQ